MLLLVLVLAVASPVGAVQRAPAGEQPSDVERHRQVLADGLQPEDVVQQMLAANHSWSELEKLTSMRRNFTQIAEDFRQAVTSAAGHSTAVPGFLSVLNSSASFQRVVRDLRHIAAAPGWNAVQDKWKNKGLDAVSVSTSFGWNYDLAKNANGLQRDEPSNLNAWGEPKTKRELEQDLQDSKGLAPGELGPNRFGVAPFLTFKFIQCLNPDSCGMQSAMCVSPNGRVRLSLVAQKAVELMTDWTELKTLADLWSTVVNYSVEKFDARVLSGGTQIAGFWGTRHVEGNMARAVNFKHPVVQWGGTRLIIPFADQYTVAGRYNTGPFDSYSDVSLTGITAQHRGSPAETAPLRAWGDLGAWGQLCWPLTKSLEA